MLTTQFIKNPFTSRFCEQMNVPGTHDRQVAAYLIGTPNPSSITNPGFMAVCLNCAKSIVEKLPDELLKHVDIEKALNLISEEQREGILDKLIPPADPGEALDAIMGAMDEEDVKAILSKHGYVLEVRQIQTEQQIMPVGKGSLPEFSGVQCKEAPDQEQQKQQEQEPEPTPAPVYSSPLLKCPECDFETTTTASLNGHIGAKHRKAAK